ncbi:MAG: SdpI family protein [Gemmatimonadota bacterium]
MESAYARTALRGLLLSLVVLGYMLALSAWAWLQIPAGEAVPVHFDAAMRPDRWGSKTSGLLGLPITCLVVAALFALYPRFEPRRANLERSSRAYLWVWGASLALLAAVHTAAVRTSVGSGADGALIVSLALGLVFIVMGNFLGKIRSNFGFGIRTPWTLTSERAWSHTHRLGGRLFMALGAAVVVAALAATGSQMGLVVKGMVAGLLAVTAVLIVYSYTVWRGDPDRRPQG